MRVKDNGMGGDGLASDEGGKSVDAVGGRGDTRGAQLEG